MRMFHGYSNSINFCAKYINLDCFLPPMETETVSISTEEYVLLKKKAEIADDAMIQLHLSFEDLRKGRVTKF